MSLFFLYIFSATKAMQDAGVSFEQIEQACVGYVYGMSYN